MKRFAFGAVVVLGFLLVAGTPLAFAQATFKVPFEFQAGGKKLPAGEYGMARNAEGQITLRQESTGKEFQVPFTQRLAQPSPPVAEPRLVFDEVGNFEPSYTEYFTVYLLAEVWLPGEEGFLVHTTKGAHKNKTVSGQSVKK